MVTHAAYDNDSDGNDWDDDDDDSDGEYNDDDGDDTECFGVQVMFK